MYNNSYIIDHPLLMLILIGIEQQNRKWDKETKKIMVNVSRLWVYLRIYNLL